MGIGKEGHLGHAEIGEDLRTDAVFAQFATLRATGNLGLHLVGLAGHEADDQPAAGFADDTHRALEHLALLARPPEHIVEQRNAVHPHESRIVGQYAALLQHHADAAVDRAAIIDRTPLAAMLAVERAFARTLDQMIVLHPVFDQVADRADLELVTPRELHKVVEPGHRAVIVHDLADHARGIEPGQARNVDRRFGMSRADQHPAIACDQREHVARGDDVLAPSRRVDCDGDGARAVCGADPGGHAFARFDADGEGGFMAATVAAAHQFEAQRLDPRALERQADKSAAVGRHEVDRIGRGHLRRDHQIALVLAVLIVDQHEHAPVARFLDDFLDRDEDRRIFLCVEEGVELAQGFGGGVPVRLGAVAQGVGMEARRAGEGGAGHAAGGDGGAHTADG